MLVQVLQCAGLSRITNTLTCSVGLLRSGLRTSSCLYLDPKWRQRNRLPVEANRYGPLTDLPDFSYLDGRPVPPGKNRLVRMQKQQEIAQEAVRMLAELEFAKNRHQKLLLEEADKRKQILDSKLKPKGAALLKSEK